MFEKLGVFLTKLNIFYLKTHVSVILLAYYALFKLRYFTLGSANKEHISKIFKIQKRAYESFQIVFFKSYLTAIWKVQCTWY